MALVVKAEAEAKAETDAEDSDCDTGVCETNSFVLQAFVLQGGGRSCSPATDLVLLKLILPHVLFSGGVFFHRHW